MGFDMQRTTKGVQTGIVAAIAVLSTAALAGCAGHNTPSHAGGEASRASQVHARDAIVDGLKNQDESRFSAAVSKANRTEAAAAWSVCKPVLGKPAKVTYDDEVDPNIIGVILHPYDRNTKRCWVTLSWAEDNGWTVSAELTPKDQQEAPRPTGNNAQMSQVESRGGLWPLQ